MTTGGAVQAEKPWVWFVWLAVMAVVLAAYALIHITGIRTATSGRSSPYTSATRVHAGVKEINCRFCS